MTSVPTQKELRSNYRRQAKKAHPDLNGSQEKFNQLHDAYNFLLEHIANPRTTFIPNEVTLDNISHNVDIILSFEESCLGTLKRITFERSSMITRSGTCSLCWGRGMILRERNKWVRCNVCSSYVPPTKIEKMIRIPAGIKNNQKLVFESEGHALDNIAGSLVVKVSVKKDACRSRKGNDIIENVSVTYSDLLLGKKIIAKTVHGDKRIDIPFGSFNGDMLRLRGKGISTKKSSGDHLVNLCLISPDNLTTDQTKALQELRKVGL